eukprot:CAMPEP_0198219972 /NCGR_PEP_ID=MMETSP1445-20131203/77012_1 /TAXON_ID=36898 /ORGANISM="Pyramimonas sp., Strain CCMP2087" /LENGTH=84 /DNA_ID=CAMNT_0043897571 /DNA_START=54 /DNA_END=304 /DNA_ORIENTATION=-
MVFAYYGTLESLPLRQVKPRAETEIILNKFDLEDLLDEDGYPDIDYITQPNGVCSRGLCYNLELGETGKDPLYDCRGGSGDNCT